jgi:hypothetical protein
MYRMVAIDYDWIWRVKVVGLEWRSKLVYFRLWRYVMAGLGACRWSENGGVVHL